MIGQQKKDIILQKVPKYASEEARQYVKPVNKSDVC